LGKSLNYTHSSSKFHFQSEIWICSSLLCNILMNHRRREHLCSPRSNKHRNIISFLCAFNIISYICEYQPIFEMFIHLTSIHDDIEHTNVFSCITHRHTRMFFCSSTFIWAHFKCNSKLNLFPAWYIIIIITHILCELYQFY
jgi:hypothetical protein